jgi:hypothetical protein
MCSKLWAVLFFLTWEGNVCAVPVQDTPVTDKVLLRNGTLLLHLRGPQSPQYVDCTNPSR